MSNLPAGYKRRHLIVDGMNLAYRAHHATGSLTFPDGKPSGAAFGFFRSILGYHKILERRWGRRPTVHVAWDGGHSERRVALLPTYKDGRGAGMSEQQRQARRDALNAQVPIIKQLVFLSGGSNYYRKGVEADDIMAVLAMAFEPGGAAILSKDSDFHQLIRPGVSVIDPSNDVETWSGGGLEALVVSSLVGDKSDAIPGLGGVGPVKAKALVRWLKERGKEATPEAVAELANDLEAERVALLELPKGIQSVAHALMARRGLWERNLAMMDLRWALRDPEALEAARTGTRGRADGKGLVGRLRELGFHSLVPLARALFPQPDGGGKTIKGSGSSPYGGTPGGIKEKGAPFQGPRVAPPSAGLARCARKRAKAAQPSDLRGDE